MIPPIVYQIFAITSCVLLIFTVGYYLGYRRTVGRYAAQTVTDREEMLSIEKALKRFWDDEKEKLEKEKAELLRRISFLEGKVDQYRQKAAGIGMMGLRRSRLADMFIGLLIENENLEEKLFMQNLKLKQERDEFLENDLRNISYKRILLSELISQAEVRREMEKLINDRGRWKRLELKHKELGPLTTDVNNDEDDAV
jgi:hypothetical protein